MQNVFDSRPKAEDESHWMTVSDLMAGLMIVFLFIAIALMRNALTERDRIKEVAVAYQQNQVSIYLALKNEFDSDLEKWDADIDQETLTFTFNSPEVLFRRNDSNLSQDYKELLSNFFPRYVKVIDEFKGSINEVRIEGHTSSVWNTHVTDTEAYFLNMQLSQGRTRSVLEYAYQLEEVRPFLPWIKSHIAAVGYSSSRPIMNHMGNEDHNHSRRVTFRVVTNAEIKIQQILESDN